MILGTTQDTTDPFKRIAQAKQAAEEFVQRANTTPEQVRAASAEASVKAQAQQQRIAADRAVEAASGAKRNKILIGVGIAAAVGGIGYYFVKRR